MKFFYNWKLWQFWYAIFWQILKEIVENQVLYRKKDDFWKKIKSNFFFFIWKILYSISNERFSASYLATDRLTDKVIHRGAPLLKTIENDFLTTGLEMINVPALTIYPPLKKYLKKILLGNRILHYNIAYISAP